MSVPPVGSRSSGRIFVQEHRGKKIVETRSFNTVKRNLKQSFYVIGRENDHIRKLLR